MCKKTKYLLRQTASHSSLLVARQGDVSSKLYQASLLVDSFNSNLNCGTFKYVVIFVKGTLCLFKYPSKHEKIVSSLLITFKIISEQKLVNRVIPG